MSNHKTVLVQVLLKSTCGISLVSMITTW